jgi:DNA helicase-2/ATP-dependent DNA helicase PcrA
MVQAAPGSGKTTNIQHMWSLLPDVPTVYLVFGKSNQLYAESVLPQKDGSSIMTLNSLGARAIYSNHGRTALDTKKVADIVKRTIVKCNLYYVSKSTTERNDNSYALVRAVNTAKMYSITNLLAEDTFNEMVSLYDLDVYEGIYEDTREILRISDEMVSTIDFNDQIRLPVIHGMTMPFFKHALNDEVQDYSPIQALLVASLSAEKYVFVGDNRQSIYGFRGAMNDSMEYLRHRFNCDVLPLSISYRCPVSVVNEAKKVYPLDIEAWDKATNGTVQVISERESIDHLMEFLSQSDKENIDKGERWKDTLILCRVNRPLISLAFDLLREMIPCYVVGRGIEQGLLSLIKKMKVVTVGELIKALSIWLDKERAIAFEKEDEGRLARAQDKVESVSLFCERCHEDDHVSMVSSMIKDIFDNGNGVCLSTVHKAKGAQAKYVFLLDYGLFGSAMKRAKKAWQREQEKNVLYVAITRAQEVLTYLY